MRLRAWLAPSIIATLATALGARSGGSPPSLGEAGSLLTGLLDCRWDLSAAEWQKSAASLLGRTSPATEAGSELCAAVQLAMAIEAGGGPVDRLPASPDVLRVIRRGCLMPVPDDLAARLAAPDGTPAPGRLERLRLVAGSTPAAIGRAVLRPALEMALAGGDLPDIGLVAAAGLGRVGDLSDALRLAPLEAAPYPELGGYAASAVQDIADRLAAAEDWQALARFWIALVDRLPDRLDLLIEAADVAVVHDLPDADAWLERLARLPCGQTSELRDACIEAALGQAFLAIGRGGESAEPIARALAMASRSLTHDRSAKRCRSRALLLRGLAHALRGEDAMALADFGAALEAAPYEHNANLFADVAWGPFGILWFLQHRLIDRGDAPRAVAIAELLLEAERRNTNYLPPDADEADDRVRTSLPLLIAQWQLVHLARPERVAETLKPLLKLTAASKYFDNSKLEAQCHLTQGDALCYLDDPQGALAEYQAAAKIYHDLEQEELRAQIETRDQALEPPLLAYRRVLEPWWYSNPAWTRWTSDQAHVELRLAFLEMSWFAHDDRALEHLRRAQQLVPDDEGVRLELAHWLARRGDGARARRLLACVEPSLRQLYNVARTYALLGEKALSIDCLERCLSRFLKTDAARERQRRLARTDPDLAAIRSDPHFIELVQRD